MLRESVENNIDPFANEKDPQLNEVGDFSRNIVSKKSTFRKIKYMKTLALITFLITQLFSCAFAQENVKPYTTFTLKNKVNDIEFLVYDTDLTKKKPVLLYLQGSLPIPIIFLDYDSNYHYSILENFDLNAISKDYHLVAIASPFTPLATTYEHISQQGCYVPDTAKPRDFNKNYLLHDKMEVYQERIKQVIRFLEKQSWVKNKEIHVFGHSQGSRIATVLGATNKKIKSVGLFAYNPFGRLEQYVRQARKDATAGKISWKEADSTIQSNIDFMNELQIADTLKKHPHYTSWKSFSKSTLKYLLTIKHPLYIAYGTEDNVSDQCDMLPLLFIEHGKSNYEMKRYAGLEHNFFPVDENGEKDYKNGQWKQVIRDYLEWLKQ